MSWYRWLTCTACVAVVDALWIHLLLALAGFLVGAARSPLSLLACVAVALTAVVTVALRDLGPRARYLQPPVALIAVGAAVLASAPLPAAAQLLAALASAGLWITGARHAREPATAARTAAAFRRGIVVLAAVLALEAAGAPDLGSGVVLLPFFALALSGMALAQAPDRGPRLPAWLGAVAGSIAAVLAVGLVLAGGTVVVVRGGLGLLRDAWLAFAAVADQSVRAMLGELDAERGDGPGIDLRSLSHEPADALVLLVLIAGGLAMIWGATLLLRAPRQDLPRIVLDLAAEEREAVDPGDTRGLGRVFEHLVPRWLRRRRAPGSDLALAPGIREVVRLYHQMLALARGRGLVLDPAHTPFERRAGLRGALPDAPVDALTARFVAACYGGVPAPADVIERLRRALERAGR